MAGPNSAPNGDASLVIGHVKSYDLCAVHGDKEMDECQERIEFSTWPDGPKTRCKFVPLRTYLAMRNRLRTGKTS